MSRKKHESFIIGPEILVTVEDLKNEKAYLKVSSHTPFKVAPSKSSEISKSFTEVSRHRLTIERAANQRISIGDDIVITVVKHQGDKVRIGVQAPRDIAIHRLEVYEAIKALGTAAQPASPQPAK